MKEKTSYWHTLDVTATMARKLNILAPLNMAAYVAMSAFCGVFDLLGSLAVYPALMLYTNPQSLADLPVVGAFLPMDNKPALVLVVSLTIAILFTLKAALQYFRLCWQSDQITKALLRLESSHLNNFLTMHPNKFNEDNFMDHMDILMAKSKNLIRSFMLSGLNFHSELIIFALFSAFIVFVLGGYSVLIILLCAGLFLALSYWMSGALRRLNEKNLNNGKHIRTLLTTAINGWWDIRIYNRANAIHETFSQHNAAAQNTERQAQIIRGTSPILIELSVFLFIAVMIAVFSLIPHSYSHSIGILAIMGFRLAPVINRMTNQYQGWNNGLASARYALRELSYLENKQDARLVSPSASFGDFTRGLSLERITYYSRRSRATILQNAHAFIKKGSFAVLRGPSGIGKSTLINILTGFLEPAKGIIKLDDTTITPDNLAGFQALIGYVGQNAFLFEASLLENITFEKDAAKIDAEMLADCLQIACLTDLVSTLPEGLDTLVGEKGKLFSGGEGKRIALARALYRNPKILVLDEATEGVDSATERRILSALKARHGMTVIFSTHHDIALEYADQVFSIEKHQIVESAKEALSA